MRIGIYVELLKVGSKSGISRHIEGLVKALIEQDQENQYFLYYSAPVFGKAPEIECPTSSNFKQRPVRFSEKWIADRPRVWWDIYLPLILTLDRIDVFHGPNHFVPTRGSFKRVITIHDLAYFYMNVHGEGMDRILESWTRKCVSAADKIITVSDATKADCLKEGVALEKVETVYQGYESKTAYDFSEAEKQQAIAELGIPEHYMLFIGTLQPRKNLDYLLEAFAKIADQVPHQLILAGAKADCYDALLDQAKELGIAERVTFTGYVSDLERVVLYENADLFVYPSKYEGFGLVLLEAMSYQIPVVTTNISSLPEVGGEAALYAELEDVDGFASTLKVALTDDLVRARLIEEGVKRTHAFTWQDTAINHLKLYKGLVS